MDPISFTKNLYTTCTNNSKIREDGKTLTIFDRLLNVFRGKHNYDHFERVCERFSEDSIVEQIKCRSKEEQIEILGRMRQIQKKITNKTSKQKCDLCIKKVESNILLKNTDEYFDAIFT